MGAQLRRALGQQERRLARRVALEHRDGNRGMAQAAGIALAPHLEAVEMTRDLGAQRLAELELRHGLRKVQTTAGGTLRQMRRPWSAASRRRSRNALGTGGAGP